MKKSLLLRDTMILNFINFNLQCDALNFLLKYLTHLGGATFTLSFSLLTFLFLPIQDAIKLSASLAISHLIVRSIKKAVGRFRPYVSNNINIITPILKDYSFPSGHSASAFSVAVSLGIVFPKLTIVVLSVAFLVAFSRIYLGHHYPTDTVVGALIGSTTSIILFLG